MKKIIERLMLGVGIALSLLFAFDVKTHVVYAADDDPAPTEDDEPVTTNDDDDNINNNNDDDEENEKQAQEGKEIADNVKIMNAEDDNESNTIKYVENVDDDQMDKNAAMQAKEVSEDSSVMETKPMTDYTMSDCDTSWVPYWYWFTIMNNQSSSKMPKKHPTNVKTSKKNVKKYQNYVHDKANTQNCIFMGLGILALMIGAFILLHI